MVQVASVIWSKVLRSCRNSVHGGLKILRILQFCVLFCLKLSGFTSTDAYVLFYLRSFICREPILYGSSRTAGFSFFRSLLLVMLLQAKLCLLFSELSTR